MRNKAAHIAIGVDIDGIKHALGIWVGASEGAKFWAGTCATPHPGWCRWRVVVASGVRADDDREILGVAVGDSEDEVFWRAFLARLKKRAWPGCSSWSPTSTPAWPR